MTITGWRFVVVLALSSGCRQAAEPGHAAAPAPTASQPGSAATHSTHEPFVADDCPQAGTPAEQEIAAQANAIVPLKPGLTLSTSWHRATQGDEVECLTQIQQVDGTMVGATANCSMSTGTQRGSRRTCRDDMRAGHMYYTGAATNRTSFAVPPCSACPHRPSAS